MNTKDERLKEVLDNIVSRNISNVPNEMYDDENGAVTGAFNLIYDSCGNPYTVTMVNGVMEVTDIHSGRVVLEVSKQRAHYSFPVLRTELPLSLIIEAYKVMYEAWLSIHRDILES